MNITRWGAVLGVAAAVLTAIPAVQAQVYVPYGSYRFYRGRTRTDIARRTALRADLIAASTRVHNAEMRGRITRGQARSYYRRLDRVRDLLRNDRAISTAEYNRWRDDLRRIRQDVRFNRVRRLRRR